jgi:hypothetical protein
MRKQFAGAVSLVPTVLRGNSISDAPRRIARDAGEAFDVRDARKFLRRRATQVRSVSERFSADRQAIERRF